MPTIPASMAPEIYRHLRETGQADQIPDFSPAPAKSKYRAVKTEIDGRTFDSKKEANRYLDLREQQKAGLIKNLECQVPIPLMVRDKEIGVYVADFRYLRPSTGRNKRLMVCEIEDVKSEVTRKLPVYRLKRKILEANGIVITEV